MSQGGMVYSPLQRKLLRLTATGGLRRINILEGSVRSGKTYVSLAMWARWVAGGSCHGNYLMAGRTLSALERNVLEPLVELVGAEHFSYSLTTKKAWLFGRKIYLEGAGDNRSQEKIRGLTLTGAYCDELTLLNQEFFAMLLSRLSQPGALLIATTNPDSPRHWLAEGYLNRAHQLDLLRVTFHLEDNPVLDPHYIRQLQQEYTGVFYRRYILGEWVAAQGAVYRQFADAPHQWLIPLETPQQKNALVRDAQFLSIGVDFGGSRSLTAFVATAIHTGFQGLTVVAEHLVRGEKGEIDARRISGELVAFIRQLERDYDGLPIRYCFADNEAQYLITTLRRACGAVGLGVKVLDCAKIPIFQRICCTNTLLATHRLALGEHCVGLRRGLEEALWDPNKAGDVRLDNFTSNIDILDAFEYSFERFIQRLPVGAGQQKGEAL